MDIGNPVESLSAVRQIFSRGEVGLGTLQARNCGRRRFVTDRGSDIPCAGPAPCVTLPRQRRGGYAQVPILFGTIVAMHLTGCIVGVLEPDDSTTRAAVCIESPWPRQTSTGLPPQRARMHWHIRWSRHTEWQVQSVAGGQSLCSSTATDGVASLAAARDHPLGLVA